MANLSVIIPALDEAANIGRAIRSAYAAGAMEVIVVDGGSADDTFAAACNAGAQVFASEPGRARQQNVGAAAAKGEIVLFLHADNWLTEAAKRQIELCVRSPEFICGAFRQRIDARGLHFRLLEIGNVWRVRLLGIAYGDQGIFLRRETFDAVGGFPEVEIMEDVMLMQQIRKRGRPRLLEGPLFVSSRRWQKHGVVRQTLRNWALLMAFKMGASPQRLSRFYSRHKATTGSSSVGERPL